MCTLTWRRDSCGDLELYFNRDERKTRPVAEHPALFRAGARLFLSPRDPQGGGTWMLANSAGLVICLLNRWELEERDLPEPQSRGQLVWSLAERDGVEQIESALSELHSYHAFTLAVFSRSGDRCWEWDGRELSSKKMPPFLTSSSYRFEQVRAVREKSFQARGGGVEFHASAGETCSAYTVRMNRPDAQTWSRSRVTVSDHIRWEYLAEQPDLEGEPVRSAITLALS